MIQTIAMELVRKRLGHKQPIPPCLGPCCDYDASRTTSPTGLTWKVLQEQRDNHRRYLLGLKGHTEPTLEMLCARDVPTFEQYFDLKKPKPKATI